MTNQMLILKLMDIYQKAAKLISESRHITTFTGAGISAESGIPTFRDPGGIWDQFDPDEVGTSGGLIATLTRKPELIRNFLLQTVEIFEQAKPNPGHIGIKELEDLGLVKIVVTQNIDNLHQEAGSSNVIELHGNLFRARCLNCGRKQQLNKKELLARTRQVLESQENLDPLKLLELLPRCPHCGSYSRPDVVMFGEPVQQLPEAFQSAGSCDLMLVIGTSGVVYPAAALPYQAFENRAKIIEINPTGNYYSSISEIYIPAPAGEAMPKLVDLVKDLL